jgi:hypothetical protein
MSKINTPNGKRVAYPNMSNATQRLATRNTNQQMKSEMFDSGNADLKHFLQRSNAAKKARDSTGPAGASFASTYSGKGLTGGFGEGMGGGVEITSFKEQMMPRSMSKVQRMNARHMMINEMQ